MDWTCRVQSPTGAKGFFSLPLRIQTDSEGLPSLLSNWAPGALSLGINRSGGETDHSPPSIAEFNNVRTHTSTPPYTFMEWYLVKQRIAFMAWYLVKHRIRVHGLVLR